MGAAALLRAGLENAFGLPMNFNKPLAFVDGQRERLFAVNILAGLHRSHGNQRVPVINRAADDGVNILSLQQPAKVGIAFGAGKILLSGRKVDGVNVTDSNDLTISPCISCVAPALRAAAYQRKINFLAGRQRFRSSASLLSGAFVHEPRWKC